jgi:hypothetical protein
MMGHIQKYFNVSESLIIKLDCIIFTEVLLKIPLMF